jgi:uncharacterized membrane protein YeaQ/YmgE (transglycosylase-associated protein family)
MRLAGVSNWELDVMHYVWMFIVGIVIGAIARLIMPGADHMSIIATGILGIIGSFVGGFIVRFFAKNAPADGSKIQPAGIVMSVVGALIVLFIYNRLVA